MRCFIAIDIPYFDSIASLQRSIEGRVKLVEKENIHITLKFLGEVSHETLEKIEKIVRGCIPQKYNLRLKGIGFFPNERYIKVIWIGVEDNGETEELMKCIDKKLSVLGFKKEKNYIPHLTVARAKGKIKIKNERDFREMLFGEITVEKIKIKKSTLTDRGPIYEDLSVIKLED